MNHGIVDQIEDILMWSDHPMTAQEIAAHVKLPDLWSEEKLQRNIYTLLVGYNDKRWCRVSRGKYVLKHEPT
jgi:hypothetical protein